MTIASPSATDRGAQVRSGRIAFIQAGWHKEIVDQCRHAFLARLRDLGIGNERIDVFTVPGAFEIPLQAKILAKTGAYIAIVAAGMVVDGGIYRHEFVANAVIGGLMQVQLDTEVPVLSMVLTPQHFHGHEDHRKFFFDHFLIKGTEAANACMQTISNMEALALKA
jgi:6,7-dimethyl-8-ribityllumazine synthase